MFIYFSNVNIQVRQSKSRLVFPLLMYSSVITQILVCDICILSVQDEGYSRNASCALILISTPFIDLKLARNNIYYCTGVQVYI